MFKRFLIYGLPLYLVFIEQCIRFVLSYVPGKSEEASFGASGVSICVAGLGLLFPVIVPKPVGSGMPAAVRKHLEQEKVVLTKKADQTLIRSAWFFVFVCTTLWGYCIWVSHFDVQVNWLSPQSPLLIGLLSYAIGIVHTEVKDVV